MNQEELRTWLAKKLREESIPDVVWDSLVEDGYTESSWRVSGPQEGDDELQDLLHEARRTLTHWKAGVAYGAGRASPARARSEVENRFSKFFMDEHQRRREVFARCVWAAAGDHAAVQDFRQEVLGGSFPLTYDQALRYLDEDGHVRADAPKASKLEALAKTLAETFTWKAEDASWFALCSHYIPPVATFSVEASVTRHQHGPEIGAITLTVEPWLPAGTVAKIYREAQRQMLRKPLHGISSKRLRLLYFVEMIGEGLSWRERMELWNEWEALEGERYEDRSNFRQAYNEVRNAVLDPGYAPLQQGEAAVARRRHIERVLRRAEREIRFIRSATGRVGASRGSTSE